MEKWALLVFVMVLVGGMVAPTPEPDPITPDLSNQLHKFAFFFVVAIVAAAGIGAMADYGEVKVDEYFAKVNQTEPLIVIPEHLLPKGRIMGQVPASQYRKRVKELERMKK